MALQQEPLKNNLGGKMKKYVLFLLIFLSLFMIWGCNKTTQVKKEEAKKVSIGTK